MNKSGNNFNKKGLKFARKKYIIAGKGSMFNEFFEGRVVGVKLTHDDGPRSVTSDLWAMPRRRAALCRYQIRSQNHTGHAICVYKMGYRQMGIVWPIAYGS